MTILNVKVSIQDERKTLYQRVSQAIIEQRRRAFKFCRYRFYKELGNEIYKRQVVARELIQPVEVILHPTEMTPLLFVCEVDKIPSWLKQVPPIKKTVNPQTTVRKSMAYTVLTPLNVSRDILEANFEVMDSDAVDVERLRKDMNFAHEMITTAHPSTQLYARLTPTNFKKVHNDSVKYVLCTFSERHPLRGFAAEYLKNMFKESSAYYMLADTAKRMLLESYGVKTSELRITAGQLLSLSSHLQQYDELTNWCRQNKDVVYIFDLEEDCIEVSQQTHLERKGRKYYTGHFRLVFRRVDANDENNSHLNGFSVFRKGYAMPIRPRGMELKVLNAVMVESCYKNYVLFDKIFKVAHEHTYSYSVENRGAALWETKAHKDQFKKLGWDWYSQFDILSDEVIHRISEDTEVIRQNKAREQMFGYDMFSGNCQDLAIWESAILHGE